MKIKWYGTASVGVTDEITNKKILFDPFVPLLGSRINVKYNDFDEYDEIFITHGHFDHIGSLKKLCKIKPRKIYCTKTPYNTLLKKGINKDYLILIQPNDVYNIGPFEVKAIQSKHIVFDKGALRDIILNLRSYLYIHNVPFCAIENKRCLENGETLLYYVKCNDKSLITMGSLGICDDIDYPQECDIFLMPYQGKKDLLTTAKEIISKLSPKRISLIHWDNSFPPVSKTVDTNDIEKYLLGKIDLIKPNYKEVIDV